MRDDPNWILFTVMMLVAVAWVASFAFASRSAYGSGERSRSWRYFDRIVLVALSLNLGIGFVVDVPLAVDIFFGVLAVVWLITFTVRGVRAWRRRKQGSHVAR